jgi:hypothetical protein
LSAKIEEINENKIRPLVNSIGFFMDKPFWRDENLEKYLHKICDRNKDELHESIKNKYKLIEETKNKAQKANELRPATKGQQIILKNLNYRDLGVIQEINSNSLYSLETLAQLRTSPLEVSLGGGVGVESPHQPTLEEIQKQNRRFNKIAAGKYETLQYLKPLIQLNSPLKNSYCNTLTCCESVLQANGKYVMSYCKNRWCMVCNHNKTAELINGYYYEIEAMKDKQFVTLTYQNVTAENIAPALKMYKNFWRQWYLKKMDETKPIRRILKKGKDLDCDTEDLQDIFENQRIKGILKFECTYNANTQSKWFDTYHPHIHILIDGKKNAEQLQKDWLIFCKQNELIADPQAQKIKPCDNSIAKELFKYFTKISSSTGKVIVDEFGNIDIEKKIYIHALDTMFQTMKGFQVFTAFGIKKMKKEEEEEKIKVDANDIENSFMWDPKKINWINHNKDKICNYKPSNYEKNRRKYIVNDKKKRFLNKMPKVIVVKNNGSTYIIREIFKE